MLAMVAPSNAIAQTDIKPLLKCQKQIARAGAHYANVVVKRTLRCTNKIAECQINCDNGVYGPSCTDNPPPCCDSDDRNSNTQFSSCMDEADSRCLKETDRIADAEISKRGKIQRSCEVLTEEQLCGAETPGLNFVTLNAGCEAILPGYVCNLANLLDCVGGPLESAMAQQIGGLLDPRSSEALQIASPGIAGSLSGIARTVKRKEDLPAGKVDVWSISGNAGDQINVRIKTRDDTGLGQSNIEPVLTYLSADGTTPVANTTTVAVPCSTPNTCGTTCPSFTRRFPFSGTFFMAVRASASNGCGGGGYQLVVTTPTGALPVLAQDDVDPTP